MNTGYYTGALSQCEIRCSLAENTIMEDASGYHIVGLDALHLSNGRIFLEEEINKHTANKFAEDMLYFADLKKTVDIYISSPGGEVNSGLMIYDVIQSYKYPINIYCTGLTTSMGAVILAGGQKGRRFILPHSQVMIHEPLIQGGLGGNATTIEKTAKSILEVKAVINGIIAKHTGKTVEEVNRATEFDNI